MDMKKPSPETIFFFMQILRTNFIVCLPTSWPSCKVVADQEWWLFVWKHGHCLKWVDVGEKLYSYKVCFSQKKTKTQLKCTVALYWDPCPGTLLIWLFILNHSLTQWLNQYINPTIHSSIHPSIDWSNDQSINQSINQSILLPKQLVKHLINHSFSISQLLFSSQESTMCHKFVNLLTTLVVKCLRAQDSLRKQPTFCDPTIFFPGKWCLRKERRDSILIKCHYPDLDGPCDWLKTCLKQSKALLF